MTYFPFQIDLLLSISHDSYLSNVQIHVLRDQSNNGTELKDKMQVPGSVRCIGNIYGLPRKQIRNAPGLEEKWPMGILRI